MAEHMAQSLARLVRLDRRRRLRRALDGTAAVRSDGKVGFVLEDGRIKSSPEPTKEAAE